MLDWSLLNIDVLVLIAEKLDYYEDFKAFSGVCTSWRRTTGLACEPSASRQTPWLLLPTPQGSQKYRFQGLNKQIVLETELPFNPPKFKYNSYYNTCKNQICSSRGWLIFVTPAGDIFLVHPLFKTVIQPPPLLDTTFKRLVTLFQSQYHSRPQLSWHCKFSLSANPLTTSNYTLFATLGIAKGGLALWRRGDKEWTTHTDSNLCHVQSHINSDMGAIYTVDYSGNVFATRISTPLTPSRLVATLDVRALYSEDRYLVELAGVLFLIERELGRDYRTSSFNAWEVNVESGETKRAFDLRNKTVFVGGNSLFSTDAFPFQNCKPNCIYYAGCRWGRIEMKMGVFDLTTGRHETEDLSNYPSSENLGTPLWVESSLMHSYK